MKLHPVNEPIPPTATDKRGRLWLWFQYADCWRYMHPDRTGGVRLNDVVSHWLPFNAIPIPDPPRR